MDNVIASTKETPLVRVWMDALDRPYWCELFDHQGCIAVAIQIMAIEAR